MKLTPLTHARLRAAHAEYELAKAKLDAKEGAALRAMFDEVRAEIGVDPGARISLDIEAGEASAPNGSTSAPNGSTSAADQSPEAPAA